MHTKMQPALRKSACAIFAIGVAAVADFGAERSAQRILAHRFAVTVDDCQTDLGSWQKVTGLDATMDLAEYRSGGRATDLIRYLRPSLDDGTVTLSRPASSESEFVRDWLAEFDLSYEPVTIGITLIDGPDQPVATWTLSGVVPRQWEISGFDPAPSKAATEILVLAHEGLALQRSPTRCARVPEDE